MNIETKEIILKTGGTKQISSEPKTICEIFYYQAENMEQMALGNLYIVAELDAIKDCGHLNNLLASLIKREFYLYPQKGAIKSFQAALKKANAHLAELAKQGNCEWLGKLHFICTAINRDELFFAQAGNSKAFLFRQGHLVNLGRKIVPSAEKPHPAKVFSGIVSGKIEEQDRILLATPLIEQLFSTNGLKQIIFSQKELEGVHDQINKVLREQNKLFNLAVLLLEVAAEEIEKPAPEPEQNHKITTPPIDLGEIIK